jgi:arsenate reductase (glutaredoxin)
MRRGCEIKFPEPQPFLASSPCGCHVCAVFTVYAYQNCDTCRKALKWLAAHGVPHQVRAIRETPPTSAELKAALQILGGDIRKLFNASGVDYRELGMKDRLPTLSEADAILLLSENGNLVKRPFLIGKSTALCGFKEDDWRKALL